MRSAVDLPQPDGPSRLTNSPWPMSSDMLWSATVPLEKIFETPRRETMASATRVGGLCGRWDRRGIQKGSVYRQEAGVDAIASLAYNVGRQSKTPPAGHYSQPP